MMRSGMDKQMQGPRAPMDRGYNRPGFAGRGPMTMKTMGYKKGGMVTPKGNGCCAKNKPCKMS